MIAHHASPKRTSTTRKLPSRRTRAANSPKANHPRYWMAQFSTTFLTLPTDDSALLPHPGQRTFQAFETRRPRAHDGPALNRVDQRGQEMVIVPKQPVQSHFGVEVRVVAHHRSEERRVG